MGRLLAKLYEELEPSSPSVGNRPGQIPSAYTTIRGP